MRHINNDLGDVIFKEEDWEVSGEFVSDKFGSRHQYWMSPIRSVNVLGTLIQPHERIKIEESWKYNRREALNLWEAAGFKQVASWVDEDEYGQLQIPLRVPFL